MGVPKRPAPPLITQVAISALSRPAFAAPLVTPPLVTFSASRWVVLLQPGYAGSRSGLLGAGLGRSLSFCQGKIRHAWVED